MFRRLILNWLLSTLALLATAYLMPGIYVSGFFWATIAALVIGLVNGTLGALLKLITFPLTVLTLGLFWLVINGLMLMLASFLTPGFEVSGFFAAFFGALTLSILNILLRWLLPGDSD
jgi:putative membrane protein